MKARIFMAAACALAMGQAAAQGNSVVEERVEYNTDKYKVETNRFWNNWFVSVGGGAQMYFGDHDRQADFGKRLAPALDVAVGKWFTPGIGLRLTYSGLQQKGATKHPGDKNEDSAHGTGEPVQGGGAPHWLERQKFNMGNVHADVMFNVINLFCGYDESCRWEVSPYGGIGWAMAYDSPSAKEVSANVGIVAGYRIGKALSVNLDVRGMFVNDRFDGEGGGNFGEGNLSATIGLAYRLGRQDWNRSKTVYRYDYGDLESMRQKLNAMSEENMKLKKALADGDNREARTIVRKIAAANLVTFEIGKSKLGNEARANLGMLAEIMKEGDRNAVYTITGYADAGTGSGKLNQRLSRERAENVRDCLVKEFGVSESQLRIDYKGGVSNMFYNDPRLSRAVITRGE